MRHPDRIRALEAGLPILLTTVLLTTACADVSGYELRRIHIKEITIPDTVAAAVPFTVLVGTQFGACDRKGPERVSVSGNRAEVEPFYWDFQPAPDVGCLPMVVHFTHEVSLRFDSPGQVTVVVVGLQSVDSSPEVVEIERMVVVRP